MSRINMKKTQPSQKKAIKQSKYADLPEEEYASAITDEDNESELDSGEYEVKHEIKHKIQSSQSNHMRDLSEFFSDAKMMNPTGDPTTNIIDRFSLKCYKVPDNKIPRMFKILEACRRNKMLMMFNERQQQYSGIMLDFDIYQDQETNQLFDDTFYILCQKITELLIKLLQFQDRKITIYMCIVRKPKITFNQEKNCYKDGFHLLIPGIQVKRGVKKLLINELITNEIIDATKN